MANLPASPIAERRAVAPNVPIPRNRYQASGSIVLGCHGIDLVRHGLDPLLKVPEVSNKVPQKPSHRGCEVSALVRKDPADIQLEGPSTLPHGDPILQAESPHLVDEPCPGAHKLRPHAVKSLQIHLLSAANGNKTHRGPCYSFRNRFGINDVVLVALHIGFDELGWNDPDPVTKGYQLPRQPLGTRTGFHANQGRRSALEELKQALPLNRAFWTGCPPTSTPTTWNTFLPISMPNTDARLLPFCSFI